MGIKYGVLMPRDVTEYRVFHSLMHVGIDLYKYIFTHTEWNAQKVLYIMLHAQAVVNITKYAWMELCTYVYI